MSIEKVRLRLSELYKSISKIKKLGKSLLRSFKNIKDIFYYQNLLYISNIIYFEIINHNYNNPLANYFRIKKTKKLVAKNYFWPTFCQNIETYIKDYDICLTSKIVYCKLLKDFQSLLISIYY